MKRFARFATVLATMALVALGVTIPALASTHPGVNGMSTHHGEYWGGTKVTVYGYDFQNVERVMFGGSSGQNVHVLSQKALTVVAPWHGYGKINVRVVTSAGTSAKNSHTAFSFVHPTMNSHIQGGLTGHQEQKISASVRAHHHGVHTASRASKWTPAMGLTAYQRARSWLGLPYSWAGGNGSGPTRGVCSGDGGDLDCHIIGFDCSGLTQYAWWPYKHMAHYAATQKGQAGRFHPAIDQLEPGDLVFFSAYIPNGIGHVAIYAGNGYVIQAEESGTTVMRSKLSDVIRFSGHYRGATRPMSTGRQGGVPKLGSVTSQVATKGGTITITGNNLSAATVVRVGSTPIYSFARHPGRLVVKAPAHSAGKVTVAVSNAWGTARHSVSYVGPPHASRVSPAQGTTAGGNQVSITGSYISTVTRVTVGTTSAKFSVASSVLTLTMPAHAAGVVPVTLYSRFGTSNVVSYTYVLPVTPPSTSPPSTTASSTSAAPPRNPGAPKTDPPGSGTTSPSPTPTSPPSSSAKPTSAPSSGASSSGASSTASSGSSSPGSGSSSAGH